MTVSTSRILIVGGGFAGVWAALAAARQRDESGSSLDIVLISKDDQLTIRPRLYQKNPAGLRTPLRATLEPAGVTLICATIDAIDAQERRVTFTKPGGENDAMMFDRLVLATGSETAMPPIEGLAEHGWTVNSHDDALAFDAHLKRIAALPADAGTQSYVIIGAGMTGIEMATELRGRIAEYGGAHRAAAAKILLIERGGEIGPDLGPGPRPVIAEALADADVEVRLNTHLTQVDATGVTLSTGTHIEAKTVIVATGLRASALCAALGQPLDALGRLEVDEMLRVKGLNGVFAAGDVARAYADDEHLALMSCQHAMPMGKCAGHNAARDLCGVDMQPYRQPTYATCIDLGESGAVYTTGWERTIEKTGAEAKALKTQINEQWIYPPTGSRKDVLANAGIAL